MFNYWRTPKCFFMLHIAPIFSGECFLSFLIVLTKQRVFRHNHQRFLVEFLEQRFRHILLVYDKAEHVFVEPAVGHYKTAVDAIVGTPAVFNLPLNGIAVFVESTAVRVMACVEPLSKVAMRSALFILLNEVEKSEP